MSATRELATESEVAVTSERGVGPAAPARQFDAGARTRTGADALADAERRGRLALGLAIALVLVWGANFSVQKVVFAAVGPNGFLLARYLIMPALGVLLLLHRYGRHWPRVSRSDAWLLLRLGVSGHLLHVGLVTWGIHLSTAFSSSVILASGPIFTLLLLRLMGVERLAWMQVAGVGVAMSGVLLFMSEKLAAGSWMASGGDAILILSVGFFAYYTVAAKAIIERLGAMTVMVYATFAGSIPVVAICLVPGSEAPWTNLSPWIWAGLFFAVVISAFMGWLAWGWINAVRGVARTAPFMYLVPAVAGAVSWGVGGDEFTLVRLGGAAVTLAGVAVAQWGGQLGRLWRAPARARVRAEAPDPLDERVVPGTPPGPSTPYAVADSARYEADAPIEPRAPASGERHD